MADAFISSLVGTLKILQATYKAASWFYGKLSEQKTVKKAIAATAEDYANVSCIESALKKLIETDEFSRELEKAESGEKAATEEWVADLLVDKCGFITGITDRSHRDALEVVKAFLRNLEKEILRSPEAPLFIERRNELRHQETIRAIHQIQPKVSLPSDLKDLVERTREASAELTANSLANRRLGGKPQIALQAIKYERENKSVGEILDLNDIHLMLMAGSRLLLEAPAGRGKSTALVQLAKQDGGITFLIDLPAWMRWSRQGGILVFIAGRPAFQSRGINAEMLAKLSNVEPFLFLLNGWNEVSEADSTDADLALRELEQDFPKAGIIVATRSHHISPPLPGAIRAELLPLNRTQRRDYLQQRLTDRASEIVSTLENDPVLDGLTQTFFFLAEVATIFESGSPLPPTKMGVLNKVINLLEQSEEHGRDLQRPPLARRASKYLEGLATQMTALGATSMTTEEACAFISSVSRELNDKRQIQILPNPDEILNTLSAHHILERSDSSSETFSFEHQQFQEFYAAMQLKRELMELVQNTSPERKREFTRQHVNKPAWEESLCMVAEEIGAQSAEATAESEEIEKGKLLIGMALTVDPIFAAKLSRLCGKSVWKQVRTAVSERLRLWYEVDDENHRQCAVAGMLASGSDEFSDIILPLLTSEDDQVRLGTYRAGTEFHLSSLGANWRKAVGDWKEDARADFVTELASNRWMSPEAVADFALADPSLKIKVAAIQMLDWGGANKDLTRLLEALDEESFEKAVRDLDVKNIPPSMRPRVLAICQRLLNKSEDPRNSLRILLRAAELGDTNIAEKLKHELTRLEPDSTRDLGEFGIEPSLKIVQRTQPEWVSEWVAERIADGSLWSEQWISYVTSISENLKERLVEKISGENLQHNRTSGIISVLSRTGAPGLAETVFAKLKAGKCCVASETNQRTEDEYAISGQLKDLFRAFPPDVAVAGLSKCFANEFDAIEFNSVIELFSNVGYGYADLRGHLQDELRQSLRTYLKSGVPFTLNQVDFQGEMKANLATALARIGEPEDMTELDRLIRSDIDRIRSGVAARQRGERNALAMGCANRWHNWYVRAVTNLDVDGAAAILFELLKEPEYESEAASALLRLATIQDSRNPFSYKTDYSLVWEARAGRPPCQFDEERRQRYSDAIKQHISTLMDASANQQRLRALAAPLAALDSENSAGLILEIMALGGEGSEWSGVKPLENLLFGGTTLPTEAVLKVLNPMIERLSRHGIYSGQIVGLLKNCLCLMPFVDSPSFGVGRIRQILTDTKFPYYELSGLLTALGQSRCKEALALLRELATANEPWSELLMEEWMDAVASFGSPESNRILLSFIDLDAEGSGFQVNAKTYSDKLLALHIANIARVEPAIKQRVFQLSELRLSPPKRALLAQVIAQLGTGVAILPGLNLLNDVATPPIPYELRQVMEDIFLERRPYGKAGNTYALAPRSSDEIRGRLFEMALKDNRRMRSAFSLLGQIEVWRLEYGRPSLESRHPAFDSGESWPTIRAEFLPKPA